MLIVSRHASERGASMLISISVMMIVIGLGVVAVQFALADLRTTDRMIDRSRHSLVTDIAAGEALDRIARGASLPFADSGTVGGVDYRYDARPVGAEAWSVSTVAGDAPDERTVLFSVGRDYLHPYSLWAPTISTGPASGSVRGRLGADVQITFGGRAFGDTQELVYPDATCAGCDAEVFVAPRPPVSFPDATGAGPCPADPSGLLPPVLAGGTYRCDGPRVLNAPADVSVSGDVVLHLGEDVSVDLGTSSINASGSASALIISQPSAGSATISSTAARIRAIVLAPETPLATADLSWQGVLDIGSFTAQPGAALDGAWDPSAADLGWGPWSVLTRTAR